MLTRLDPWNLFNGSLYNYGLNANQCAIAMLGLLFVMLCDWIKHFRGESIPEALRRQNAWFRWLVYLLLIVIVLTWGVYGKGYDATSFIYFQF